MTEQTQLVELCRQIHERVLAISEKLDRKVDRIEHEDLELRVRLAERTLTRHKTIGGMIAAGLGALFGVSR